jgi:hypothetical protein
LILYILEQAHHIHHISGNPVLERFPFRSCSWRLTFASYISAIKFDPVHSYSFVLQFYMVDSDTNAKGRVLQKRESSSGFVSSNGQATNTCQDAVVYNLVNGQLFAYTTNPPPNLGPVLERRIPISRPVQILEISPRSSAWTARTISYGEILHSTTTLHDFAYFLMAPSMQSSSIRPRRRRTVSLLL